MKNNKLAAIVTCLAITSGCTSIPSLDSSSPDYLKTMSFQPIEDKAVLYMYRTKLSDFQGAVTTVDIGEVDLAIFPNCVHRFELAAGKYNFEPDGFGTFAIEKEIELELKNGTVNFVELHHTSRIAIPNVSKVMIKTQDDFEKVMATDELCVTPIKMI
ncbi:MAG: hypothetical protein ACPG46_09895 [Thalassotalea sp.]